MPKKDADEWKKYTDEIAEELRKKTKWSKIRVVGAPCAFLTEQVKLNPDELNNWLKKFNKKEKRHCVRMSLVVINIFAAIADERLSALKDNVLLAFKNQDQFNNLLNAIKTEILINLVRDLKTWNNKLKGTNIKCDCLSILKLVMKNQRH